MNDEQYIVMQGQLKALQEAITCTICALDMSGTIDGKQMATALLQHAMTSRKQSVYEGDSNKGDESFQIVLSQIAEAIFAARKHREVQRY